MRRCVGRQRCPRMHSSPMRKRVPRFPRAEHGTHGEHPQIIAGIRAEHRAMGRKMASKEISLNPPPKKPMLMEGAERYLACINRESGLGPFPN